ncbi:MAG: cbb3-type cytochrome oxidase assembly protein CcoS [Pseudomonadales bacterium]
MEILGLLIPLSIVLVGLALWFFVWAADHEQFDDLDRHALDIFDDTGEES